MAKAYLCIISSAILILIIINSILAVTVFNVSFWMLIGAILASVLLVIVMDTFFAILMGILPKSWFCAKRKCFNVAKKEQKIYEKLKIKKWKDYVWDLGGLGGFSKSKVEAPQSPEYFERFIIESNRGVTEHFLGSVFGFFVILLFPQYMWSVGIPVALVNVFLNTCSTMVLRYNIPKLKAIYTGLVRRQKDKDKEVIV